MNLRPAIRWLLRPVVLGTLVAAACAAWHYRPLSRDVLIPVQFRDGRSCYINGAGRIAIPGEWDAAYAFDSFGIARVLKEKKEGWIDRQGRIVIAIEWDGAMDFDSDDFAWVQKGDKWGRLDRAGNVVLPVVWPGWFHFDAEGMACVKGDDGLMRWIGRTGTVVLPGAWNWAGEFDEQGLAVVRKEWKWGWIDRSGKIALPLDWDFVSDFDSAGMALVKQGGKRGWIDRTGKVVLPLVWEEAEPFDSKGMALVAISRKHGWIDRTGKVVIPLTWDRAQSFNRNDRAWVGTIWGGLFETSCYIDRTGKVDPTPPPDVVLEFDQAGMAIVRKKTDDGMKWGWVNRRGEMVSPATWDGAAYFTSSGLARVCLISAGWSVIDRNGRLVVPAQWDSVDIQKSGHVVAFKQLEPGRLEELLAKVVAWIRPNAIEDRDRPPLLCHVYDRNGQFVWRNDDPTRHLPLLAGAFAGGVAGLDGLRRVWRRWRGSRTA
jgi:hypothetical protein